MKSLESCRKEEEGSLACDVWMVRLDPANSMMHPIPALEESSFQLYPQLYFRF